MKYLFILCLFLFGCNDKYKEPDTAPIVKDEAVRIRGYEVRIITYDGCQYIQIGSGESQALTHKGNCNNPIHQNSN